MGHVERVCKNKGRPRYNQPQQPRAEAQVVEEDNDQEEQVFAVSCSAVKGKATDGWLIDSGCTNQMTPDASIFKSIDRSFKTNVKVENGHFIKVEGKGDVLISTPTGTKLVKNVLLVPEIDRNLLSIAQLLEKGYSVVFKGKECLISDPSGSKLMTVAMTEKSFIVGWNKSPDSAYTAAADESKLCHKRLSHANYMSMAQLTKEDSVKNFTNSVEKERKFLTFKEVHDMHGNQSSAQIKELKAHVTSLKLELKSLQAINRDMAEQLENKASEAEKLREQNIRLQSRISELKIMLEKREKEIFILTKKLEDDNSESLSGMKNLTAQENNLLSENETLQAEKALLKENFAFEGDEASNQVQRLIDEANTLQQQLESLHIQKAKLELQFDRKKQKSSEKLNEMENQKSELKQMVEDLQRDLEAKGDEKNDLVNQIIREYLKNKSLQHASQ
ncbi:COP1-interactive protein 1-like [Gossypium arboreum]|uniref:COP1-interactive protein 1-like n=1 Tax=Gossypium arboreum TaxID=29729 RepID=UPI0022F19B0C|nr:COP1-interactive protein 1-like [Gossypium arboreum]